MKSLARNISAFTILFTSGQATADVIYSGLKDISIPTTYGGTYIDVDGMSSSSSSFAGWDFNPFLGGVYLSNNSSFQPARTGTDGMDTVLKFGTGATVSASGLNFATGSGGSLDHLGSTFTAGQEGYLGFKLGSNYGWMRVIFTNNSAGAKVLDWAYENSGAPVQTGNVLQSGSVFTLNSAAGSFSLGSAITGGNSVIKTGANTTTLTGTSNYTGTTTVSAGILAVNGTLANTSTTVGNTGTLQGSGSIGGSVTVQNGGTIAAGNSIQSLATGALSLEAGSTFAYELDMDATPGVAGDLTAVTGTLDIANGAILTLTELGSIGSWTVGDKLTLISYSGLWNNGEFMYDKGLGLVALNDGDIFTFSGMQWMFDYDDSVGSGTNYPLNLTVPGYVTMTAMTAVPEPNVAALLGGLGILMLLRRRRTA